MADNTYCVAECVNKACPYHLAHALGWPYVSQADRSEGCTERIINRPRVALSDEAWAARKPPHPVDLLNAEWERPDLPARARVGVGVKVPRKDK